MSKTLMKTLMQTPVQTIRKTLMKTPAQTLMHSKESTRTSH
jgi:hypothetical protein